jgi:hypothetical protein
MCHPFASQKDMEKVAEEALEVGIPGFPQLE